MNNLGFSSLPCLLLWEDNGFVLYYKSLAEEQFRWPRHGDEIISLSGQQIN
jgi:transposase